MTVLPKVLSKTLPKASKFNKFVSSESGLFTTSTGANGEKVLTINGTKNLMYTISSATNAATNSIDSSYFGASINAVTSSGKNTRTSAAIVVETNNVTTSSYRCEFANTQDVTNVGPQRMLLLGDE